MFCREHVAQLRDHEAEFRARGARVAAVGLGDPVYARAFRDESGIAFPLLVDAERAAYRAAELRSATLRHLLRRDNWFAPAAAPGPPATGRVGPARTPSSSAAASSSARATSTVTPT